MIDGEPVHRNQRARAAIDQYIDVSSGEVEAGIKSSAGAEGVAAADELQSHRYSPGSCENVL
jgi:hypothetical protein